MSAQAKRYDTLVVENSTSKSVPMKAAGGRVVSWAAGHAIAECSAYEDFVKAVIDGDFLTLEEAEEAANQAQLKAEMQREVGYE
ncbi:hypothetical protein D3C76_1093030 [compost metagenome]